MDAYFFISVHYNYQLSNPNPFFSVNKTDVAKYRYDGEDKSSTVDKLNLIV